MTTLKSIPRGRRRHTPAEGSLAQALSDQLIGLIAVADLLAAQSLGRAAREQLQSITRTAGRMRSLVEEALEAESAPPSGAEARLCVREVVDELEADWRHGADQADVLVSCVVPTDLFANVDRHSLKSLLSRLVDILRAKALCGVLDIEIHALADAAGGAHLEARFGSVSDLDAQDLLRLEFCRRTARLLNGDIVHKANAGPGAHVVFTARLAAACEPAPAEGDLAADAPLAHTHLLIVDDNATNRMVASALCGMFGCTSENACDGEEAVEAVKARPFDLVLMDIRMPRMDGVAATRAIRSLKGSPGRTPIVALTANADPQSKASYLAAGMNGVVDKPINPGQLLAALHEALAAKDAPGRQAAPAA